jgi:predicted TIM-barrel fold metal-dependent hydrolase
MNQRILDFHAHCNSSESTLLRKFAETYEAGNAIAVLSGGLRYGAHDYETNEKVITVCREYSGLFVPMARIDLWDTPPDPAQVHYYAELGAKGFKFIYPYHEYDHDIYMPLYAEIEKIGLPVLFHTGNFRPSEADIVWQRPVLKNMNPLNLDRIARSFQKLQIVMAHLGTSVWRHEASELLKMHENIYADLAGSGSWQGLSAEELAVCFRPYIHPFDPEYRNFRKLIFGSDAYVSYPAVMPAARQHYEMMLSKLGLPQGIRDGIMGETAASWLGIAL